MISGVAGSSYAAIALSTGPRKVGVVDETVQVGRETRHTPLDQCR